jgi:hypothetical protein
MKARMIAAAVLLLTASAVAAVAAAPQPALAATDLVVVTNISPTNSVATKGEAVQCPSGTVVLGGGGIISNGSNRVHLDTLFADGFLNGFRAGASEIRPGDYTSSWRVRVYAICGPQRLTPLYVSHQTLPNNGPHKQAQVQCPRGMRLVSVGASIDEQSNYVMIDDMEALSDLRTANVWAVNRENPAPGTWTVSAYGVCVNQFAISGLELIETTSPTNFLVKDQTTFCPRGKQLYGLGAAKFHSGKDALYQTLRPEPDNAPGWANALVTQDPTGASKAWSVKVQAFCAN